MAAKRKLNDELSGEQPNYFFVLIIFIFSIADYLRQYMNNSTFWII